MTDEQPPRRRPRAESQPLGVPLESPAQMFPKLRGMGRLLRDAGDQKSALAPKPFTGERKVSSLEETHREFHDLVWFGHLSSCCCVRAMGAADAEYASKGATIISLFVFYVSCAEGAIIVNA
eukprot:TRINITY_DN17882_c0_g1_i1.p1 TRINITY_DN17882_c0_g1~~TRINITY_DN17882_c0_g1_i1.p1  ORF type:complete len:122 (-),score=21.98 TRINITY_DN17882_c0_g1_i1:314-679(-)